MIKKSYGDNIAPAIFDTRQFFSTYIIVLYLFHLYHSSLELMRL